MGETTETRLERREVVARLLAERGELLVVAGLGAPSWDCAAAGDHPLTFPMWGAMGGAAMVGLGIALARPERPVLVITGDGEMLMGLGSLATIGARRTPNLAVAVLDNQCYGETGMQPTHTAHGVDLAGVAAACGFAVSERVTSLAALDAWRTRSRARSGPCFAQIEVRPGAGPLVLPPRDGAYLKDRFREALLGPAAFA